MFDAGTHCIPKWTGKKTRLAMRCSSCIFVDTRSLCWWASDNICDPPRYNLVRCADLGNIFWRILIFGVTRRNFDRIVWSVRRKVVVMWYINVAAHISPELHNQRPI